MLIWSRGRWEVIRVQGLEPRLIALPILLAALVGLGLGVWLQPVQQAQPLDDSLAGWAAHGLGTHQQLGTLVRWPGLGPCRWLERSQLPCPTCGMTTAFALALRGRLLSAVACQPFGAGVAVMTVLTAAWCAALVFFGVAVRIRLAERSMWLWLAAGGTLLLLSWFYKAAMHVAGG